MMAMVAVVTFDLHCTKSPAVIFLLCPTREKYQRGREL